MASNWKSKLLAAVAASEGWKREGNRFLKVTTHETPDHTPASWWDQPTYDRVEILSYVVGAASDNRAPVVFHRVDNSPWVQATDQKISFSRSLEILSGN